MQNFIVLGIIPGTNVQIDFTTWLVGCTALILVSVLLRERHVLHSWVLSHYVAYRLNRLQVANLR